MVEQPPLASGAATLFDLSAEPVIVIHGARQKVEGDLIDTSSCLSR